MLLTDVNLVTEPKPHQRACKAQEGSGSCSESESGSNENNLESNISAMSNGAPTSGTASIASESEMKDDDTTSTSKECITIMDDAEDLDSSSLSCCTLNATNEQESPFTTDDSKRLKLDSEEKASEICSSMDCAGAVEMSNSNDSASKELKCEKGEDASFTASLPNSNQSSSLHIGEPIKMSNDDKEMCCSNKESTSSAALWENVNSLSNVMPIPAETDSSYTTSFSSTKRLRLEPMQQLASPQVQPQVDILICGNCRTLFTSLPTFIQHKRISRCRLRFVCHCQHQ